jgi:hypothetical protein
MKNERLESIRKRIAERPPKGVVVQSVDFYLGWYIGEFIVKSNLPCLSCDNDTLHPIEISEEELEQYTIINGKLIGKYTQDEWDEYISYRKMLKEKYLPKELKCYVPNFVSGNMDEVKRGIRESLWDSDVCNYSTLQENIEIGEEVDWFQRRITLKLSEQD